MTVHLPCALIVTDAAKSDAEAVLAAYRGTPMDFGVPLIPIGPNATPQTVATHWLMFDAGLSQADVIVYQGFSSGSLPPLASPLAAWGKAGLIGESRAVAAVSAANLQVYAASGDVEPIEFCFGYDGHSGVVGGRGLMKRPDPEF